MIQCIDQDDVGKRNAQVMRIREIYSQSLAVTARLGEDKMTNGGLNSWVESSLTTFAAAAQFLRPTADEHWK
jgi:hypothetical protein